MTRKVKISEVVIDKISGEWGEEVNGEPGVKVLRTTNFTNDGFLNLENVVERKIKPELVEKKKLIPGDVIIEKSGGSPNQPVGRVVYFNETDVDYLCNNFTAILRPSKELYPKFFFYALFYLHLSKGTLRYQNKTTGILNLKLDRYLDEEKIPLPDLKTQQEIAQVLEQADKARQQRKAANALTDQFLQSSFFSLFGDPVKNEKRWNKAELKNVLSSIDSGWSPVCEENPRINENHWAVLKLGAVTYCKYNPLENKKMITGVLPKENIEVKKGDLLFTRKNTKDLVAATAYVFDTPKRLLMSDTIFRLKYIEEKVSGVFLWYLLLHKNVRKELQSLATGSSGSMPNISKEKLMKLIIPLPPLSLQQQFASIVAQAEQLRQKQRESELELENLFQSLLQKYFG